MSLDQGSAACGICGGVFNLSAMKCTQCGRTSAQIQKELSQGLDAPEGITDLPPLTADIIEGPPVQIPRDYHAEKVRLGQEWDKKNAAILAQNQKQQMYPYRNFPKGDLPPTEEPKE